MILIQWGVFDVSPELMAFLHSKMTSSKIMIMKKKADLNKYIITLDVIGFSQVITWLDLLHFAIKLSTNYIIFSWNYDIVGCYTSHQQHRECKMRENLHLLETAVFLPSWQLPTVPLKKRTGVECSCRFLFYVPIDLNYQIKRVRCPPDVTSAHFHLYMPHY